MWRCMSSLLNWQSPNHQKNNIFKPGVNWDHCFESEHSNTPTPDSLSCRQPKKQKWQAQKPNYAVLSRNGVEILVVINNGKRTVYDTFTFSVFLCFFFFVHVKIDLEFHSTVWHGMDRHQNMALIWFRCERFDLWSHTIKIWDMEISFPVLSKCPSALIHEFCSHYINNFQTNESFAHTCFPWLFASTLFSPREIFPTWKHIQKDLWIDQVTFQILSTISTNS